MEDPNPGDVITCPGLGCRRKTKLNKRDGKIAYHTWTGRSRCWTVGLTLEDAREQAKGKGTKL